MLMNYTQFALRYAARKPNHFLSPPVSVLADVQLPRASIVHYLDTATPAEFVTRELPWLQGIPPTKRVPVHNLTDLLYKDDVTFLQDKLLPMRIRAWERENRRGFRVAPVLEEPHTDVLVHAVANYNLLKGLYRYQNAPTSVYHRYTNLFRTYWESIAKACTKAPASNHIVSLEVPDLLPSYNQCDRILQMSEIKYARAVRSDALKGVLALYAWLNTQTRAMSVMASVQESSSASIVVQLTYRGHCTFFRLSDLWCLSQESELPSRVKLTPARLQKLWLLTLLKFQKKVESLLTEEDTGEGKVDPEDKEEGVFHEGKLKASSPVEQEDSEDEKGDIESDVSEQQESADGVPVYAASQKDKGRIFGMKVPKMKSPSDKEEDFDFGGPISGLLDAEFDAMDEELSQVEDLPELSPSLSAKPDTEETAVITPDYSPEHVTKLLHEPSTAERLDSHIATLKASGAMSSGDARALRKVYEQRTALKSPYTKEPIDQAVLVTKENKILTSQETAIAKKEPLVSPSLQSEVLFNWDKKYLNEIYHKDVQACVLQLEKVNIIVKDYAVERVVDAVSDYEVHKVTLRPFGGKESTVYFRTPVVDEEGEFLVAGNKYRMRKLRTPVPIAKVSPIRVALTSNYSKLFVSRTERRAYDRYASLVITLKKDYLGEKVHVKGLMPGGTYSNLDKLPNTLSALKAHFKVVEGHRYTIILDPATLTERLKQETIDAVKAKGFIAIGHDTKAHVLACDAAGIVYDYSDNLTHLGTIEHLLGVDEQGLPQPFSVVQLLGEKIPLGLILSYYLGLTGLLSVTGATCTQIGPRARHEAKKGDVVLRFEDTKLIISTTNAEQELLFAGFNFYKDALKKVELSMLDSKEIYLELFQHRGATLMHLRELSNLKALFIDPITADVLRDMSEPDTFIPLLLRANSMLSDFSHPDINDPRYSRIRGYDRIPGLMYRALAESVREAGFRHGKRAKIELDPYKVWNYITQDTSVKTVEEVNPIVDTKEVEAGTFSGLDGISKDATPAKMRRFHPKDAGLISEATVDSSDVALNFYLTPYAKMADLRGRLDETVTNEQAKLFSTSVLLSPMGEYDDTKRINLN